MKTREKIQNRFNELEGELDAVSKTVELHSRPQRRTQQSFVGEVSGWSNPPATSESVDVAKWYSWGTSAMHLLKLVFGESSIHFTEFEKVYHVAPRSFSMKAQALKGIFSAAKVDFAGGYAISLEASIAGEIFADFVALAKEALNQKQKDVAAVLGCAALEDTLKKLASMNGLEIEGKDLQEIVNALKTKGLVSGAEKKILHPMRDVRNDALHADWDKISEIHAASVISTVEQLILSHFSAS
jgi:uncharacterized protein YutE (UPF0331/DUF86 family)